MYYGMPWWFTMCQWEIRSSLAYLSSKRHGPAVALLERLHLRGTCRSCLRCPREVSRKYEHVTNLAHSSLVIAEVAVPRQ